MEIRLQWEIIGNKVAVGNNWNKGSNGRLWDKVKNKGSVLFKEVVHKLCS